MPPIRDKSVKQKKTLANKAGIIMLTVENVQPVSSPRRIDPYDIFAQAEAFKRACGIMGSFTGVGHVSTVVTAIVNQVFALELYLKCLLTIEGKEIKKIHNIKELFEKLKYSTQQRIRHDYNKAIINNAAIEFIKEMQTDSGNAANVEFDFVLQEIQEVFQEFRYDFEYRATNNIGPKPAMGQIMASTRKLVLRLRSTWDNGYPAVPSYFLYKGATKKWAADQAEEFGITKGTQPNQDRYYLIYECQNCGFMVNFKIDMPRIEGKNLLVPAPINSYPVEPYPINQVYNCPRCFMRSDVSNSTAIIEAYTGRKPDLSSQVSWLTELIGN